MYSGSRHAPRASANSRSYGSQNQIPRSYPRMPVDSMNFSTASADDVLPQHFAHSSCNPGARRHQATHHWSPLPANYGGNDDYPLSMVTNSGCNQINTSASNYALSMASEIDPTYDMLTDNVLSRHAPLSNAASGQSFQQYPSEDVLQNTFMPMDIDQYTMFSEDGASIGVGNWPNRGFTPPPEDYLEVALSQQSMRLSPTDMFENTHLASEDTICENLGPSKLLPYTGPRRSPIQPRPIKPASERSESHSSSLEPQEYNSPPEDSADKVKARNDPLYDAKPNKDGYYHCPMVDEYKCTHKPTKQKCIYAKYLDSHLRPYRCKLADQGACEETRFSSNACLFRHEREAHGLHNHGVNPYMCIFPDCDRAKDGNGFPRRWNQRDHMKRVHDYVEEDYPKDRQPSVESSKRRKSTQAPASVQMRRTGSSYAKAQAASAMYSRDSRRALNVSRHDPQLSYANQAQMCNVATYPSMDNVQFSQVPMFSGAPRHSPPFNGSYPYQMVY